MKPRPPLPEGPYLVVGLARSGVAAAQLLGARGERVIGVDAGAPPRARELAGGDAGAPPRARGLAGGDAGARSASGASAERGIEWHLRDDGLGHLDEVRAVVKSPGVPAQASVIAAARARGIPVLGELELAWRLLPNEFIAVTATNGKTTTVELIGHIHREARLPVAVAGNVGTALSSLVGAIDPHATVVCEASSFQLEDTLAFAPEAAVLLNMTPDHLDRHGTFAAYRAAKLEIFAHQGEGDVAVLPVALADVELPAGVRRVCFDAEEQRDLAANRRSDMESHTNAPAGPHAGRADVSELRLRGEHNRQNALAAATVCLARGIAPEAVAAGLRSFPGVPHRLQEVGRREGVLYVNDSKATNVASTLVALDAFPEGGVHLILGGRGKGQDFAPLREAVAANCRAVYLIGEDAPGIALALEGMAAPGNETASEGGPVPLHRCGDLERAVAAARRAAQPGEIVLLSPACASFDQFTDFEARGERFAELVQH